MQDNQPNRRWAEYVARAMGDLENKTAAKKGGVSEGTIANWIDPSWAGHPSAGAVDKFASGFGLDPIEAAARAGVLPSAADGSVARAPLNFKAMSAEEVNAIAADALAELGERAKGGGADHPPIQTIERRKRRRRLRFDASKPPA